jgi:ubiquitin carboxyl-terminal hydrolase 14
LYELVGTCEPSYGFATVIIQTPYGEWTAIITHKGAAADAGHYVGFVKRSAFHPRASEAARPGQRTIDDEDNDWYKFDDDKVSIFPEEKLATLGGGGSCSVYPPFVMIYVLSILGNLVCAYVLLYKTKPLA